MSESVTAVATLGETALQAGDIRLVALQPQDLQKEQTRLIAWCDAKVAEATNEATELEENREIATRNKWRTSGLAKAVTRARQRVTFYQKVGDALRAGFFIVPNFEADVFAIRTTRNARGSGESRWGRESAINNMPDQKAEALPSGDGEYKSPTPTGIAWPVQKIIDGKEVTVHVADVVGFSEIAFPFALARSEILTATEHAMALKVFDEMASLPRKGDPMIVGRIRKPFVSKFNTNNHVTFLVAWFLDTKDL